LWAMEVARRAQASAHGRRLFVSGVASEVKKTDLQKEFGEFGHVTDIELPLTAKGVAFVEFDNARDAADALEEVTGRKLKGMVLKVKMADMQRSTAGPTMTASPDDRFADITQVESDSRHLKARGTNARVAPTATQEREDRRMHPRSRNSHERNGHRRSSSPNGRWVHSRHSRSSSIPSRRRSASRRHNGSARESRRRSLSRSPRRERSPRKLMSPSGNRSESGHRHRRAGRSKSSSKRFSRSRSMHGSESCSRGKKQHGKTRTRKRRLSRSPSTVKSVTTSSTKSRGKRRRHVRRSCSQHEGWKRSASS